MTIFLHKLQITFVRRNKSVFLVNMVHVQNVIQHAPTQIIVFHSTDMGRFFHIFVNYEFFVTVFVQQARNDILIKT